MITFPACFDITTKAALLIFVAAGLVLATNGALASDQPDLETFQGTWKLVSAKHDGNALAEDKVKKTTITFEGERFRFPQLAEYATSREGTINLDATQETKADRRHFAGRKSYAWHLRPRSQPLQGLLRPGRQATSQRFLFEARERLHPAILAARKDAVTTVQSQIAHSLSGSASPSVDG